MGYLHLFYSDYVGDNGDPISILNAAKQKIKDDALKRFSKTYTESTMVEQAFEQKYALKPDDFGAIDITNSQYFSHANAFMLEFDTAIGELKKIIQEGGTIAKAQKLGQEAILSIDELLKIGANTGGLADGAILQLKDGIKRLRQAHSMIKYKGSRSQWIHKDEILNLLSDIESNISGYALELATVYGAIGAMQYGGKTISEVMINIGSNNIGNNIKKNFKNDPQMLQDLQKLDEVLNSNNGIQSKADSIVNMHMSNGQGEVSAVATWVGFQEKNYRDISSISLMRDKTLGELGIFSYYDTDMLVNIAGSLGNNYQNKYIKKEMMRYPKLGLGQGKIDVIWNGIKNSIKLIAAADAIAGYLNANITNRVHYYVIRNKKTGEARVIGVSKILDNISSAIVSNQSSSLGINWGESASGRYSNRSKYWSINQINFEKHGGPQAGQIRSAKSYKEVQAAIWATKISISLNFSSFFAKK